jgi:diadenosine tetraphosphate (Ap4A) HIT family hydrolase
LGFKNVYFLGYSSLNEGKASGRSVSHLHWQIIPRWFKNPNAVGVFADIHVVTMSPFELKEILKKNDI